MIILDSNADVYGRCRVGGTWSNPLEAPLGPWDNAASTADSKVIDVAYEHQTGRAMFIWARNVNRTMRFRIWNGATLNLGLVTDQNIANIGNHTAMWARLASDPYSDSIMLGIQDSGSDLITSLWDGVVWDANGTQHDNSLEDQSRNFDLAYETAAANAGSAWLLWGNGTRLSRRQWNGAAWGAIANAGDDTSYINIVAHPLSGAVFSAMYESTGSATDDIWESHLTSGGAIWSARFTVWGGPTVASPVREKVCLAAERFSLLSNPLIVLDWNEVVR
jgi:hypothetical protein